MRNVNVRVVMPCRYCDEAARAAGANSTTTIAAQQREDYML